MIKRRGWFLLCCLLTIVTGVLQAEVVSLWNFENAGVDLMQSGGSMTYSEPSGFSNTVRKVGGYSFYADESPSALAPGILNLAGDAVIDGDDTFGIAFWVYRTEDVTSWEAIFSFGIDGMRVRHYGGASLEWYYLSNAGFVNLGNVWDQRITIPLNTWTHIAITADGQEGRVFVNNSLAGFNHAPQTGSGLLGGDKIFLGSIDYAEATVGCYIDEVVISNSPCDAEWVNDIYYWNSQGMGYLQPANCDEVKQMGLLYGGDINEDCTIDMEDFAIMASQWLGSNDPDSN